jgi:fucokinase
LSGGWSDTPPYCLERGGKIVNLAIEVNGKIPISAVARVLEKPVLRLTTEEHSQQIEIPINRIDSLFLPADPTDPLCIHKAVVAFMFFPHLCLGESSHLIETAQKIWRELFGNLGFELSTKVDLPKGSGLGTSSILVLACVRAIRDLFGIYKRHSVESQWNPEFNAVLAIEQLMSTGGGWQDQIGGGTKGIKYIWTAAGTEPKYNIQLLALSPRHLARFNEKLVMVYTGKTRIAKTILYNVVDNWFLRRSGIEQTMSSITAKADEMWATLRRFASLSEQECGTDERTFEELGRQLSDVRQLNVQLEKSITNEHLESLYKAIAPFVHGFNIIGAGSGGFIFGWLNRTSTREQVQRVLQHSFPNAEMADIKFHH